jgi:2-dehydro-3-deoxygluconokinase
LTDNPLGRLIERTIQGYGVDTSQIIWTKTDRIGLYFLEEGKIPRGSSIVYDRASSAFSQMQPAELPVDIFRTAQPHLLHLTGITPGLGVGPATTAWRVVEQAQEAGWKISFDLNYRSKLWSAAEASQGCQAYLKVADIVIATFSDIVTLYGFKPESTPVQLLEWLSTEYPQATFVLTLGKQGAIGREASTGSNIAQAAFLAEEVGRVGGGDAFTAGLLYSYVQQQGTPGWLQLALRWGTAMAALKYATPGDMPIVDKTEVQTLVEQGLVDNKTLSIKR